MNFKNKQTTNRKQSCSLYIYLYICKERTKVIKKTNNTRESKNPKHNINNISINMITTNELDP